MGPPRASSPHRVGIALLVVGAILRGLPYPLFALVLWAVAHRVRARTTQSYRVGPARAWLAYAVVLAVLGATSITLLATLGHDTASSPGVPDRAITAAFGQPVTVLDDVVANEDRFVPVTLTVDAVRPAPAGTPGTTDVTYRMCAGRVAITPFLVTDELSLVSTTDAYVAPDGELAAASDDLALPAGQCRSGTVDYAVPAGATVTAVHYGIVQTITWPIPPAPGG